jgi:hypothetical protein
MKSYHTARGLIREMTLEEGIPVEDLMKSEYLTKQDVESFRNVSTHTFGS